MRTRSGHWAADLYLVADPGPTGVVTEQLLAERWDSSRTSWCDQQNCPVPVDSRGRMFLSSYGPDMNIPETTLARVDLVTGERVDLGADRYAQLSPSGRRVVISNLRESGGIEVHEEDDRVVPLLDATGFYQFVGDDVWYLTSEKGLRRFAASGAFDDVAEGVDGLSVVTTPSGPLVTIYRAAADPSVPGSFSFVDPVTLMESGPIPPNGRGELSPDGSFTLIFKDGFGGHQFALREVSSGAEESFELPETLYGYQFNWRPGRPEVWFWGNGEGVTAWSKRQGSPPTEIAGRPYQYYRTPPEPGSNGSGSVFSSDGSHWFSMEPGVAAGRSDIFVASADDPGGPRLRVNPPGTGSFTYWEVLDGQMIVEAWYTVAERSHIILFDPDSGASRVLGTGGRVLRTGSRRVLALLRRVDAVAELTGIDVETGVSTLLAEEVPSAVVEPPATGADTLPPGTRIAFTVRHRFTSPHDGLWVTTLP